MSAPEKVRLKRKRQDNPLEALILTRSHDYNSETVETTPQKRIRYRLVDDAASVRPTNAGKTGPRSTSPVKNAVKRLFHLKRSSATAQSKHSATFNHGPVQMPVFEERASVQLNPEQSISNHTRRVDAQATAASSALKRPGKGSTLGRGRDFVHEVLPERSRSAAEHQMQVQALADLLHEATLEELARLPRPSMQAKPKMSPRAARERHEKKIASREGTPSDDLEMTDAGDFVYDIYVLAPPEDSEESGGTANIGYLVIDEDDEAFWQSFLEEGMDDGQEELDVEDENAEDHYAADYPEDEDDNDSDSYSRHSYNPAGSTHDEEWDLRQDSPTSDEGGERTLRGHSDNNKVVRRWEKILHGDVTKQDT